MKSHERFQLHVPADNDAGASTVVIAFVANVLVAIAKTVAAMLTGSSSVRTEAVHSWVDVGNEGFVFAALRSGRKQADEAHPLGYGRASYVWSLFASLVTLAVGAVVGVWQGIHQLGAPDIATHYVIGYVVISVSFILEGASFVQTLGKVRRSADEVGRDVFEQALTTSDSPMRAVFAEDFAALIGLVVAALGLLLHQVTGEAAYDAVGSIVIGVVMGITGLLLIGRNARFLGGKALPDDRRGLVIAAIRALPQVARVTFMYAEVIGPSRYLVMAGVGISGDHTQAELATILRNIERALMQRKFVGLAIMTLAAPQDTDLAA